MKAESEQRTCGSCTHRVPGKFVMIPSPGVPDDAVFYGCEFHDSCVGVQPLTRACKRYEQEGIDT
jgi:hypothetical protein